MSSWCGQKAIANVEQVVAMLFLFSLDFCYCFEWSFTFYDIPFCIVYISVSYEFISSHFVCASHLPFLRLYFPPSPSLHGPFYQLKYVFLFLMILSKYEGVFKGWPRTGLTCRKYIFLHKIAGSSANNYKIFWMGCPRDVDKRQLLMLNR